MASLSVIVASSGRLCLRAAVDSVLHQLRVGDELLVDVNSDSPWGHRARNRQMARARGDGLVFLDDDNVYVEWALDKFRAALVVVPDRPHIFRIHYGGSILWQKAVLQCGNVDTLMLCVPNIPDKLGTWGNRYEGDYDFIKETVEKMGSPCWHSEVIAKYKPGGDQ